MADSTLYLSKKETSSINADVTIPNKYARHLRLFQIDGIRFLHKQYILGNGAILNDDSGLGKTLQTIVYISAIQLAIPNINALILCNKSELDPWFFHIKYWSQSSVSLFNKENPIQSITLSTLDDSSALKNLEWGIIVIDDLDPNQVLKVLGKIKSRFKIWLKSENLMVNLKNLYDILTFIAPNINLPFKDFKDRFAVDSSNLITAWTQRQSLHLYCKTWVLRRTQNMVAHELPLVDIKMCCENLVHRQDKDSNGDVELISYYCVPIIPSKLNPSIETLLDLNKIDDRIKSKGTKDATGLKIKRNKQPKEPNVIVIDVDSDEDPGNNISPKKNDICMRTSDRLPNRILESIFTSSPKPRSFKTQKCTAQLLNIQDDKREESHVESMESSENFQVNKTSHFKLLDDILFGSSTYRR